MAFFNVTPSEKIDRLTDAFDNGFNTQQKIDQDKPGQLDNLGGSIGSGAVRAGNRMIDVLGVAGRAMQRPALQSLDALTGSSMTDWYDKEYDKSQRLTHERIKAYQPDPKTTGYTSQVLGSTVDAVATFAASTALTGNPYAGAAIAGTAFGRESYREGIDAGLDETTALMKGTVEGGTMAGLGLVAPSLAGGLAKRIVSGGIINTAFGVGQREAVSLTLNARGYSEMAEQYKAFDLASIGTDLVMGAAFGGLLGPRAKAAGVTIPEGVVPPSTVDAALTQNQFHHATIDVAPGIPANGQSAQAHASALNETIEALAYGKQANVEKILTNAEFLGKRPDYESMSIIRDELQKAGFNDLAAEVARLEEGAKNRGLYVDPADMNVVLSDKTPEIKVGGTEGKASEIKIGNDYVPVQFRVVESSELTATMGKADNQYRDRTRAASERQIAEAASNLDPRLLADSPVMDYGAPVMTADGKIIAGNGRAAFIERAYATKTAESYRTHLKEQADALGLNASDIDGFENPVLVRVLQRDVDVNKAAILSNEGGAMGMSALEQAKVDGERLGDFRAFEFGEDGAVSNVSNMPFIRSWVEKFPTNQRSRLMDADGMLSAEGSRRLQNAIMYRAYGDSPTLSRLVEATDVGSRNIVAALSKTAARVADAKEAIARGDMYPLDLSEDMMSAVEKYASVRDSGMTVNEWVNQLDAFGDGMSGEARAMVVMLDKNIRSSRAITEAIDGYYSRLEELGDPKQGSMFEAATPTKQDLFKPMLDGMEVMYSREAQTETPAFKAWFGESKVVDESGKPLVVYHGTGKNFDTFDLTKAGSNTDTGMLGTGFYFGTSKPESSTYARGENPNVMPVYLSLKNPLQLNDYKSLPKIKEPETIEDMAQADKLYSDALRDALISKGHDGVIFTRKDGTKEVVAFHPEQIKSATGNRGTFDPTNPNINYSRGGSRSTTADLTSIFKAQFGKDAERLMELGRVKFVQSVAELPARADGNAHPSDVGGLYDPRDGTSYIVADNTSAGQIRGRVNHEIGVHSGMEEMLGTDLYAEVLAHVDAKISSGDARFMEARRLAEQNSASPEHVPNETLAYLVENAPEMPVVRRILAAVRQWVYRMTGGRFVDLNVNDLVAIASSSLRRQARMDAASMGGDVMYTRAQESTAEFQNWFGESKVVDADGKPLVVYHGTKGNFDTFGYTKDIGYHFGNKWAAEDRVGRGGSIMPVYLSAKNLIKSPDLFGDNTWQFEFWLRDNGYVTEKELSDIYANNVKAKHPEEVVKLLKSKGYDGVVYENMVEGAGIENNLSYIVFDPTQIKSATGNSGAFNPDSPSLTDRIASTNEFYRNSSNGDMISTNDNPLPTTMIPTGDTLEPIGIAIAKADAEIADADAMQNGYVSAIECAMVAGE